MIGLPVPLQLTMSKIFEKPPESVKVLGEEYKINTDFRIWLEISEFLSKEIPIKDKLCFLLINAYRDKLPPDMEAAVDALISFMNMGKSERKSKKHEKVIDFKKDQNLIYAAFYQQYGISLYRQSLHWWEFMALLSALDDNTAFIKVVGYRSVDLSKIRDDKQRSYYRKMKHRYRINNEINDSIIADALTVGGLGG